MALSPFTQRVVDAIAAVPKGKVATYGGIAAMAGSPRAARQVVRILHTLTRKHALPWQRVVNKQGMVALSEVQGGDEQRRLLEAEGVVFDEQGRIDLEEFLWRP